MFGFTQTLNVWATEFNRTLAGKGMCYSLNETLGMLTYIAYLAGWDLYIKSIDTTQIEES